MRPLLNDAANRAADYLEGLADLIGRTCRLATRFAEGPRTAGHEVPNEVVINQVLVAFGDAATTEHVIDGVQRDGCAGPA